MGDSDATEGDLPPGILESLLMRHQPSQQLRPQQQRVLAGFNNKNNSSSSTIISSRDGMQCRLEEELWGSYFVLLDSDRSSRDTRRDSPWADFDCEGLLGEDGNSNQELMQRRELLEEQPFLFLLYCTLRQEARRRGDLRIAFAASWLVTDERNAAGTFFSIDSDL